MFEPWTTHLSFFVGFQGVWWTLDTSNHLFWSDQLSIFNHKPQKYFVRIPIHRRSIYFQFSVKQLINASAIASTDFTLLTYQPQAHIQSWHDKNFAVTWIEQSTEAHVAHFNCYLPSLDKINLTRHSQVMEIEAFNCQHIDVEVRRDQLWIKDGHSMERAWKTASKLGHASVWFDSLKQQLMNHLCFGRNGVSERAANLR